MTDSTEGASTYKLSLLARRQRLPVLPGQEAGTTYGVVWGTFPIPAHGSCYVVKFNSASNVSFVAYVDDGGLVFPVDRPITLAPVVCPDFAVSPDEDGFSGTVYVREGTASLQPLSRYRGSFRGTMREVSDSNTWNSKRSLTYRPFMASMYLRYCLFEDERMPAEHTHRITLDMTAAPLKEPVDLMGPFARLPLPDAIDAVCYRTAEHEGVSGIERFAHRLLSEVDMSRLRNIAERSGVTLAYIERMDGFYLNFDHTVLSTDEIAFLLTVETAVNRLHQVLRLIGFPAKPVEASPSEAACSAYEQAAFCTVTSWVKKLISNAAAESEWICPGTIAGAPGGEWDVRTRFAATCEGLNLLVRLAYDYRFDARSHELRVLFTVPQASCMPAVRYDVLSGIWVTDSPQERARQAEEYADRMVLVLAAAAFSTSLTMQRCVVEKRDALHDASVSVVFDRAEFMARLVPLAIDLEGDPLSSGAATAQLATSVTPERMRSEIPSMRYASPREDDRALPRVLQDLLLADSVDELEVMEEPDDPAMQRFRTLRTAAADHPEYAEQGYIELIEEIEARCAAEELMSDRPLITRFCENHLGRIVLPLLEEDRSVRIQRAPDALFFARYELCNLYAGAGAYERALPEARKLLDLGPTSMQAHSVLVNVLARLGRFDEVIDVVKHALRVAFDRDSIAYLLYRMAFAYWSLGDRETAAACYRLVPRDEHVTALANEELRQLLAEMGRRDRPSLQEAMERAEQSGIAAPLNRELAQHVADATVLLVDYGFFYLASRCVYHMWRMRARDELSAVYRSLLP